MMFPFLALEHEYEQLLARMQITRNAEVVAAARRLNGHKAIYEQVRVRTEIPDAFVGSSFEREASSNFSLSPAQGDRWDRVSRHVPAGRGPFPNWLAAAIDAYHLDHLDSVGAANWTWARACYEGELFNGFGYRQHGVHSPYLWAGSNNYSRGKFTSDHGYDPNQADQQLGIIPMMKAMVAMDATLDLVGSAPDTVGTLPNSPMPAPEGLHDAKELQIALNSLGADPQLIVDGNYGRMTRNAVMAFQRASGITVDGYAGPQTWAAIDAKVAK